MTMWNPDGKKPEDAIEHPKAGFPACGTVYPTRTFKGRAQWDDGLLRLTRYPREDCLELNESAAIVFHLCDGLYSTEELTQMIQVKYSGHSDDALATDVRQCLTALEELSLIRLSESRCESVPIIRVRFLGFWPEFDPQNNCFMRLLTRHSCAALKESGDVDVLFQSVYQPGDVQAEPADDHCLKVFVTDGPGDPDFDVFDYAFSPSDVGNAFRLQHCRLPTGECLRSDNYSISPEEERCFQDFLFPVDLEHALELCRDGLAISPDDGDLLSRRACLIRRLSGWKASAPYWDDYWSRNNRGEIVHGNPGRRLPSSPPSVDFEELKPGECSDQSGRKQRVCVYTSLFGSYDTLSPVQNRASNIDYICFTDQEINVPGWTIARSKRRHKSSVLCAKEFKVLPHKFLHGYDASLYIDASTFVYDDLEPLVNRFLGDQPFVMYLHPNRSDPFDEAEAVLSGLRHPPGSILKQMTKYESEGLPAGAGLFEASFIWRSHHEPEVMELMELWWREITEFSSRDQLSLSYLVWKTGVRPKVLSTEFGTSRINPYFLKKPHNTAAKPNVRLPRNVTFSILYHPRFRDVASTTMRGEQLAALINRVGGEGIRARFDADLTVRNSCVLLTKGMLNEISASSLMKLRSNNLLIAADYIDARPRPELHDWIDVYIASSIKGYYRLCHRFGDKWVFLVTHHVDPRLPEQTEPVKEFRAGYFGELRNAMHHDRLGDVVDFHPVDTRISSMDWLNHVRDYSLHYAVRKRSEFDAEKPFLKGFTAAHCGANVLLSRKEGDAMYYLPPDYPFYTDGESESDVRRALKKAADSFNGPAWEYGLRAMHVVRTRSTDDKVYCDIESMVRYFQQ